MKQVLRILTCIILVGCKDNPQEQNKAERRQYVVEHNPVGVLVLEQSTFKKEIVSNGKLVAQRKTILQFAASEKLVELKVKNGDRVNNGQEIARLERTRLQEALRQAEINLQKSRIDLIDILVGQGYNINDTVSIPADIYQIHKIRSGYTSAQSNLLNARLNLKGSVLITPFSGVVANLKSKVHEWISPGVDFCTLIDNSVFEVEFSVLETEMKEISLNKEVKIKPFSSDVTFKGTISEINPQVDVNGLISIKAVIKNQKELMEGMNVKVFVENTVSAQLVIPKKAVVLRQNQEVVFKYVNGKAFWTYIKTTFENSTSYAVVAHPDKGGTIVPGDTVIVSGNLDLAHDSKVEIE